MRPATVAAMRALAKRDGGWWCVYCTTPLAEPEWGQGWLERVDDRGVYYVLEAGFASPQRDHVVARHHGGSNDLDNLVLSCGTCNASKGTRSLLAFLARRSAA